MSLEQIFPPARSAGAANRAMVVGIGSFGARCLAHLWPRISFEDEQRRILRRGLPRLSSLVSYALLLPSWNPRGGSGEIVAGLPDPGQWSDGSFTRHVTREAAVDWAAIQQVKMEPSLAELVYSLDLRNSLQKQGIALASVSSYSRSDYFNALLSAEEQAADFFMNAVGQARIDQDAPGQEVERFSIYLVAAANEPPASALLWPVAAILRSCLEPFLSLEITALLSSGVYGEGRQRLAQGASIYATLVELEHLSRPGAGLDWLSLPARLKSSSQFLDYIYLLDSEKHNHTLPRDEREPITAIGNALEVLLTSDIPDRVAALVGPDSEAARCSAPFCSLGTASVYIPVNEWNERNQNKFLLEVLEGQFLQPTAQPAAEAQPRRGDPLSLEHLVGQMIRNLPLGLRQRAGATERQPGLRQRLRELFRPPAERLPSHSEVGYLLHQAGLQRSLISGPGQPLPAVFVDPVETRPLYLDNLDFERPRRLPPEEWYPTLLRHYLALDIDGRDVFPTDDETLRVLQEAAQPDPNRLQELVANMLAACSSASDPRLTQAPQPELAELVGRQGETGIVPDFYRLLLHQVCQHLRRDSQGLHTARALVQDWLQRAESATRQVADFRLRLERAFHGPAMTEFYEQSAAHLLAFRRALGSRPHLPAIAARGLGLAAFIAALLHYATLRWNPLVDPRWLPILPLLAGFCLAGVVGLSLWSYHQRRLRLGIHRLEDDFARLLGLVVNMEIARLVVGDDGRSGLLPDLSQILQAFQNVLDGSLEQLRQKAEEIRQELETQIGFGEPFLRQPFPGLDDIERRLQEETRREDWQRSLAQLVPSASSMHNRYLEAVVEWAVSRAGGPVGRAAQPPHRSIDAYLLKIMRDYASPRRILPPPDLKIISLLRSRFPEYGTRSFLSDLRSRTQFFLNWDEAGNSRSFPVAYELFVQDEPADYPDFLSAAHALRLLPVANLDPFAVTALRLVYGVSLQAIPHLRRYAEDFSSLSDDEQRQLALALSEDVLGLDGSYFERRLSDFTALSEVDHD